MKKQKVVASSNFTNFQHLLDEWLEDGWMIVPESIKMTIASQAPHALFERYIAIVEKE